MEPVRLQKFLAAAGVCSRRKAENLIRQGRVAVNGETVIELGTRVRPGTHHVTVDGRPVEGGQPLVYIVLNKPVGVVSSCSHPGKRTVLDLVRVEALSAKIRVEDPDSLNVSLNLEGHPVGMELKASRDDGKEAELTWLPSRDQIERQSIYSFWALAGMFYFIKKSFSQHIISHSGKPIDFLWGIFHGLGDFFYRLNLYYF